MVLSLEYIAGFFDGEGCIIIADRKPRKGRKRSYYIKICIAQKRPYVLELIRNKYPGSFIQRYSGDRECYLLVFQNQHAAAFLREIFFYLVVKKEECELALEFYSRLNLCGKVLTDEELDIRKSMKLRLQALKKVKSNAKTRRSRLSWTSAI